VQHGRDGQQRRDRGHLLVGFAIGQHDGIGAVRALPDGRHPLGADVVERLLQSLAAPVHRVKAADHGGSQAVFAAVDLLIWVEVDQSCQLVVAQDRCGKHDLATAHESAVGLSRSPSGPTVPERLVTTSSRIAIQRRVGDLSRTAAGSSRTTSAARCESTATGVSVPIRAERLRRPEAGGAILSGGLSRGGVG